jgi:two-component system, response regulator PdtaR
MARAAISYQARQLIANRQKCPGWDSNPHCTAFETAPCCRLGYRGVRLVGRALTANVPGLRYASLVTKTPFRVVIAEDEALIRLDLREMLEEEGYVVAGEASDGETAVKLASELRPDLVILDVKMPGLDGISAAERITESQLAPVIILTAFSQRDLVQRASEAGAMAYLIKPFTKADLVPAVEVAASRFAEIAALNAEAANLRERLEVRKLLDRAKGALQDSRGLTEAQAFRWIQKTSMDRRQTMRVVAEELLAEVTAATEAQTEATSGSSGTQPAG